MQKCLVLLDNSAKSLAFQHELLMNSQRWSAEFEVTFAYINLAHELAEVLVEAHHMHTNPYTYLEIVDKAYENAFHIDHAVLHATKMMLQDKGIKTTLVATEEMLHEISKGFDLLVFRHTCFGCKAWSWLLHQLIHLQIPSYITSDFNFSAIRQVAFLFDGSDDCIKAIKQFNYIMHARLHEYEMNLITHVHTSGVKHEKVIYDYIRSKYHKIKVERVYMEDTEAYTANLLEKDSDCIIITHRNNTEFISQYVQKSVQHTGRKRVHIFIN